MLSAYQMQPDHYAAYELNIPESGNATPDVLDEMLINLRWMLTMQDPDDGGVYHKLTTPNFEGFVMPTEAVQPRYVVQKTTTAALDFAATMAQASRVYGKYPEYADFVVQTLPAAEKAYAWAVRNNNVPYLQNKINEKFRPAINTGAYDDMSFGDEFFWAATELYLSTGKETYLDDVKKHIPQSYTLPTWGNVASLGIFDWINASLNTDNVVAKEMAAVFSQSLIGYCEEIIKRRDSSCFQCPYGNKASDFYWGSLAEGCCCMGVTFLYANALTGNRDYVIAALENANYMLGQNATGYSYVTGFGTRPFKNPHHRISEADGIDEPFPGLLSGGPNPGKQDQSTCPYYTSDFADECYADNMNSYASNEIAINWNASLVAMVGWLDALLK